MKNVNINVKRLINMSIIMIMLTLAPSGCSRNTGDVLAPTAQPQGEEGTTRSQGEANTGQHDDTGEYQPEGQAKGDKYTMRDITTMALVREMELGINLGNTMDACGDWINPGSISNYEKAWGSPIITEDIIKGYVTAGFSSLRIPVAWSNMMLEGYTIHPDLLDRVEEIVNWALDCGLTVVVNLHHEPLWEHFLDDVEEGMKKYSRIWEQVSERFKDYGDKLLFESMNEVGFDAIWTPWKGTNVDKAKAFGYVNDINQRFVDIVRASGGNNTRRHLVIEVYNTGPEYAYDPLFVMPNDPANDGFDRMCATVHYYTPAVFAILEGDAEWGKARETWGTDADLKELSTNMDLLKINCVDKGLPIIVGEFAACGNNKTPEMRRYYALSVMEAVYSRGMCPMYWDTPGGEYDRLLCDLLDKGFKKAIHELGERGRD